MDLQLLGDFPDRLAADGPEHDWDRHTNAAFAALGGRAAEQGWRCAPLMDLYLSAAWRAPFRAPAGAMGVSVAELLCPQFLGSTIGDADGADDCPQRSEDRTGRQPAATTEGRRLTTGRGRRRTPRPSDLKPCYKWPIALGAFVVAGHELEGGLPHKSGGHRPRARSL